MINFPCPKSILSMTPVEGGYYCGYCDSEVLDLTNLSENELTKWKSQNTSRCVIVNEPRQNAPKLTLAHFALALLVAGGTSLFNFADAQTESKIKEVKSELKVPNDPSLGILHVKLVNQYGSPTWGNVWVVLPNGKEIELLEIEEGSYYAEIPAYCKGKTLEINAEHLKKKKTTTAVMFMVGEDLEVSIKFKASKRYRTIVRGYF